MNYFDFKKKTFPLIPTLFAALFVLLAAAQTARACSCAMNETVDKDYVKTPNIVVLKLRAVEKFAEGEKGFGYGGIRQSKLTVEKVYKGALKVGQELTFAQGGGADCIWTFQEEEIGEEYLFYLGEKPLSAGSADRMIASTTFGNNPRAQNAWVAFTCSRSGDVRSRAGDIKYLESLARVRGKTRLSGSLMQYIEASTEDETPKVNRLSNHKVTVKGNGQSIELKTDENGFYEIYDLPPGKYTVTPEKIEGYKVPYQESDSSEASVKPASHTEQNFTFRIDNRLAGKVFDTNGKPLRDVCLRMLPARGKKSQYFYQFECTKKDGSFVFERVPAGSYVLILNEDDLITATYPFRKFYYPAAATREDAAEINVAAGTFRDDLLITAPETAETVTISGGVAFEKGSRAPTKENYEFVDVRFIREGAKNLDTTDEKVSTRAEVDENGRFSIKILKGWKGKLFAEMMSYEGEYENCPKLDKLLRVQGGRAGSTVKTNLLETSADADLIGVELKFPFPVCKQKIID